jgi:hypothetical protein
MSQFALPIPQGPEVDVVANSEGFWKPGHPAKLLFPGEGLLRAEFLGLQGVQRSKGR